MDLSQTMFQNQAALCCIDLLQKQNVRHVSHSSPTKDGDSDVWLTLTDTVGHFSLLCDIIAVLVTCLSLYLPSFSLFLSVFIFLLICCQSVFIYQSDTESIWQKLASLLFPTVCFLSVFSQPHSLCVISDAKHCTFEDCIILIIISNRDLNAKSTSWDKFTRLWYIWTLLNSFWRLDLSDSTRAQAEVLSIWWSCQIPELDHLFSMENLNTKKQNWSKVTKTEIRRWMTCDLEIISFFCFMHEMCNIWPSWSLLHAEWSRRVHSVE